MHDGFLLSAFLAIETVIDVTVFRQLDGQLGRPLQQGLPLTPVWHLERAIRAYLAAHTERVLYCLTVKERVFGLTELAYLLTGILIYTYLPVYAIFCPMKPFYMLMVIAVYFLQTTGPLFWVYNLLQTNAHMVQSGGLLRILSRYRPPPLPFTKDVRNVRLKWAMAGYYELLTNKRNPLTISLGVLGHLTKQSMLEVGKIFLILLKNNENILKLLIFFAVYPLLLC